MSTDPRPAASIIVPSYRGAARLPALLDSLAAQEEGTPAFEVIVVIDGVDDGSVAIVDAERHLNARTIVFPENRGRVAALNAGLDAARGEVLIRCDDDLVVPPTYVRAHVQTHRDGAVGAIGVTRDIHEDSVYARAYGADAARSAHRFATTRAAEERWRLWAASCSITRATWQQIGPYSDAYRAYGWEDVDYGYRLHAAGIPLVIAEGAEAEHHGPARTAEARARKAYASGAARALFQQRHPEAPLSQPSPGTGPWGRIVQGLAATMTSEDAAAARGRAADILARRAPRAAARKAIAAAVEAAGFAGARAPRPASGGGAPSGGPRIAIAHDYLTQRGGAERLVLSLVRAFPEAELHTLFYEPSQTYPEYRDVTIRTSPLNRIGILRRDPRLALPILAPFASRMRIDADVVITSSSGWAHAFPTRGRKLIYCHSPARWLYLPEDYLGDAGRLDPKRLALTVLTPLLKRWDRRAALQADHYWGNSSVVVERIRRVYGIEAEPLFPPFSPDIADGEQEPISELAGWAGSDATEGGHHLVVSRLQPYKHVDRVIEAFRGMPERRLLVIGKGPEGDRLRAMAPANVRLVEGLTDAQMRWAYGNATALIAASHEDFGLTPLEAGAHGKPTLALRAGGYLDTVADGVNGVFFEQNSPEQIRDAVQRASLEDFSARRIRAHVIERFSEERFISAVREAAAEGAR